MIILSGYLSSRTQEFLTGYTDQASSPFGRGYGIPASPGVPLDIYYAADQIRVLLASDIKTEVVGLGLGERPALDLANDELTGQSWTAIDFSWISAFLVGIDLRGADLESSQWSASSDLSHGLPPEFPPHPRQTTPSSTPSWVAAARYDRALRHLSFS